MNTHRRVPVALIVIFVRRLFSQFRCILRVQQSTPYFELNRVLGCTIPINGGFAKKGIALKRIKDRQKHQKFVHSNQKQAKELPNSGIQFLEQHVAAPSLILSPSLDICGKRKSIKCRVMNFPTLFLSFLRFWMIELGSAMT